MKKNTVNKFFFPALLFCLSLPPLLDLFHPGLPVTHDGQDHIARIANFYQNLNEGVLIPRWAPNLNSGYGHPILMFLYPLSSYMASIFHALGFSFVDSVKLVFALSFILSGLAMYIWLKEFLTKHAAFIGGLLYIFAPYRFVDLYVRGALGECVAFIFPPLVLYFLFKLFKKIESSSGVAALSFSKGMTSPSWTALGSLSLSLLILSHNAISLMFLPIFLLYWLYLIHQSKNKKLFTFHFSLFTFWGFVLSAFFWLPAFIEGKYTLRDVVTQGGYINNFSDFSRFLYGQWSYGGSGEFSVQVGIAQWLSVLLAIPVCFYLYKKKDKLWIMTLGLLILFLYSLYLIDKSSLPIWQRITIIQKFQFPWRFLSVTVFATAVLGGIAVSFLLKKNAVVITILLTIAVLLVNKDYWHAKDYLNKPESFYTSTYPGTTDTGESAPIWSVRFMEQKPGSHIEVIGGRAKVEELARKSTRYSYQVIAESKAQLRENTLYFPGWSVLVDKKQVPIQYQDTHNRGVITFFLEKGTHDVQISFTETKLRLIADIISLGGILLLVLLGIINVSLRGGTTKQSRTRSPQPFLRLRDDIINLWQHSQSR